MRRKNSLLIVLVMSTIASLMLISIGCGSKQEENQKDTEPKKIEKKLKSLEDAIRESTQNASHRVVWDDGSGGEPEITLVVSGNEVIRFGRTESVGWAKVAATDGRTFHVASSKNYAPHETIISLKGKGAMILYKTPGTPSFSVMTLANNGIEKASSLGDNDLESIQYMAYQIASYIRKEYPERGSDWAKTMGMWVSKHYYK